MRDPQGSLRFEGDRAVRTLTAPLPQSHFLRSALARRWVAEGRLVSFEFESETVLSSPRLPFVSAPSEWCDAQLHAAGEFTLSLQQEAVAAGFDLKDASAWNVLFDGTRPVFCDLLSFVPLNEKRWWAAGQYGRHFLLPLLLSRRRGLRAADSFKVWRDGVPPDVARQAIGPARYVSRYWPLMTAAEGGAPAKRADEAEVSLDRVRGFRQGLHSALSWMLAGLRPKTLAPIGALGRGWEGYAAQRAHYAEESLQTKRNFVQRALEDARPSWVVDAGCNTGEFSRMACAQGARVVSLDADHDAVQRLFVESGASTLVHPVVAPLDDLCAGRGWAGVEHAGLPSRLDGRAELVLMLALIHHLAVSASIPFDRIAELARTWTCRWLVVEWVGSGDPQMQLLCRQRQRDPADFDLRRQREAFEHAGFDLVREAPLDPRGDRVLALMERRA